MWIKDGRGSIWWGSQMGDDSDCSGVPSPLYKPDPGWECTQTPAWAVSASLCSPCWLVACHYSGPCLSSSSSAANISQGLPPWELPLTAREPRADQSHVFVDKGLASFSICWATILQYSNTYMSYEMCLLITTWLNWKVLTLDIQKITIYMGEAIQNIIMLGKKT